MERGDVMTDDKISLSERAHPTSHERVHFLAA
jgi:hypothetical protein